MTENPYRNYPKRFCHIHQSSNQLFALHTSHIISNEQMVNNNEDSCICTAPQNKHDLLASNVNESFFPKNDNNINGTYPCDESNESGNACGYDEDDDDDGVNDGDTNKSSLANNRQACRCQKCLVFLNQSLNNNGIFINCNYNKRIDNNVKCMTERKARKTMDEPSEISKVICKKSDQLCRDRSTTKNSDRQTYSNKTKATVLSSSLQTQETMSSSTINLAKPTNNVINLIETTATVTSTIPTTVINTSSSLISEYGQIKELKQHSDADGCSQMPSTSSSSSSSLLLLSSMSPSSLSLSSSQSPSSLRLSPTSSYYNRIECPSIPHAKYLSGVDHKNHNSNENRINERINATLNNRNDNNNNNNNNHIGNSNYNLNVREVNNISRVKGSCKNVKRWPTAILSAMRYSHVLLFCIAFIVLEGGVHSSVVSADITVENDYANSSESGICTSRDIRNSPANFKQLNNCRVIEGFLMISLMDKSDSRHYENMEFPMLTEITEFLLLYRVNGLKSLLKLFPNLRIIRGNSLMKDYALVIYEMMHLQEIGLKSLTQISRGAVRIEKNPMLCFVDTIDWSRIAVNSESKDHFIKGNKATNECPICPSGKKIEGVGDSDPAESLNCPESPTNSKQRLCWNRQNCQKICPPNCGNRTCTDSGECCDDPCIGCETGHLDKCIVCKHLSIGDYPNRKCVDKCHKDWYQHENRRCISDRECRDLPKPVMVSYEYNLVEKPYIPFNGTCQVDCPSDYYPDGPSGGRFCRECGGKCKKECLAGNIDSIASAQRYRGCAYITGSLLIQMRSQGGHNVVRELENFLSDIEVIEGSLKIVRSFPIVSLSFFRKLRTIKGTKLESDRYALYVVDNQNIQSLFPQNVTIEKGRLFFHFNPKLCPAVIEALKPNVVDLKDVDKLPVEDVAVSSNGDKIACNVTTLTAHVMRITARGAIIHLTALEYEDPRSLLGYVIYYMAAPYQNVTLYDGRDACGGDGWMVDDITDIKPNNNSIITIPLTHLNPYTQYAYYIKTYTIATEPRGGQSPIQYFRTSPDQPDPVERLTVVSNGSNELTVQWDPPKVANGNLTAYIIKCRLAEDDVQLLEQRNYCKEPLGSEVKTTQAVVQPTELKPSQKESDCACEGDSQKGKDKITDTEAEQLIAFENELHNTIYVKQGNSYRRRRDLSSTAYLNSTNVFRLAKAEGANQPFDNSSISTRPMDNDSAPPIFPSSPILRPTPKDPSEETKSHKKDDKYYDYIYRKVNASVLSVVMKELKHYSSYTISVRACRASDDNESSDVNHNQNKPSNCSNEVIAHQRTAKLKDADNVKSVRAEKYVTSNHSLSGVKLSWPPPEDPNGLIISYTIRYQRVDIEHAKYQDICITQNHYRNNSGSYVIDHLENGNYSFIILATSLAGTGEQSPPTYFFVNESHNTVEFILAIIALIVILIAVIGFVFWFYRRKYGPPDSGLKLIASVNPEYVSMQYTPDEWEVPRDKIIQLNELGQGSFGMVYEGIVTNLDRNHDRARCAIKTVNENATDRERINFLKEAAVMKGFDTHHVVRLLGVVSRGQPTLVIMELMANGDLKGYLRSHRPEVGNDRQPPTLRRILQMAIEIADGMAYLSAKKFVHRDLAARNCMVAEDLTVKIGDFGMTRDIYETDYYRKGTKGLLPVRWMAPESLKDGVFSSNSDVFSFGIVLWEMATLASQPYQGLSNDQVLRYVIDGGVMERPENCPEKLYSLMCRCWQHRPTARPTFMQIVSLLLDDAMPNFRNVSFYHSPEGQELLQLPQHQMIEVVDVRTPLRAEEENFSVGNDEEEDPEDPNSFLMENTKLAQKEGPSNSPLRNSGCCLKTQNSYNIPDVALYKSMNSTSHTNQTPSRANLENTIIPSPQSQNNVSTVNSNHSIYDRIGVNLNRGIDFLRNAIIGHGTSSNGGATDIKDYKKLNHSINMQPDQYTTHPLRELHQC